MIHATTLSFNRSQHSYSYLLLFTLTSALVLSFFVKDNRLWLDEVFSMTLLEDPSFGHMNEAITSGLETNPPLFFYVYWFLGHTISLNTTFLKIVSGGLYLTAIYFFYLYTIKLINRPKQNFFIYLGAIGLTQLNYVQPTQIRGYSLYILLVCLHVITTHKLFKSPGTTWLLVTHFISGLALLLTHYYGLFIVAISASAFLPLLFWSRQKTYAYPIGSVLLIVCSWLLLWYPQFQLQSSATAAGFWIVKPTATAFFRTIGNLIPSIPKVSGVIPYWDIVRVALVTGLFLQMAVKRFRPSWRTFVQDEVYSFYVLTGYLFIGVSLLALAVSLLYVPILVDRYLWPLNLFILFQFAYAVCYYKPIIHPARFALPLYALCLCLLMLVQSRRATAFPTSVARYLPTLNKSYPVFYESLFYFLPLNYYQLGSNRFWMDWDSSIKSNTISEYRAARLFREQYAMTGVVAPHDFSTNHFGRFYIVDEAKKYKFEKLIAAGKIRVIRIIPVPESDVRILECIQ
ncbi:hypothetical protein [Spirosoma sp. KNUC1025]|uniref:hypothetical protein n=1 Tax=Spirosoma sp. KNUC1025 TaxID=2894082 RepID=UPI00386FCEB0|nr:hypothetical protein LN737_19125 [Spirosoma sp. KNUC1025]